MNNANDNNELVFNLRIKEVTVQDFDIQAKTEDEAVEKLKEMYSDGEIALSAPEASGYTVILNMKDEELDEIACF
jgi:hypothetical protein